MTRSGSAVAARAMPPLSPGNADDTDRDSQQASSDRSFRQSDDSEHYRRSADEQ
jgi:hypothetical protein